MHAEAEPEHLLVKVTFPRMTECVIDTDAPTLVPYSLWCRRPISLPLHQSGVEARLALDLHEAFHCGRGLVAA